jgi:hypothetical protein
MHQKKFFFLFTCALLISISTHSGYQQDTVNNLQNQPLATPTDNLDEFYQQPQYTRESVSRFLTRIYNHRHYGEKFLAFNFTHMQTLLSYTRESIQPRAYIKMVLKLFSQKLKSATFVNSYALLQLVNQLPELLKSYCLKQSDQSAKDQFKKCLYDFFLHNFKDLKKDPERSLNSLTDTIYKISVTQSDKDISVAELQQCIAQFLEISLNKLIWSPVDNKDVWDSVKNIALSLELLLHSNAIANTESLDELYWSLIYRFCYFLEIAGTELHQSAYEIIVSDLNSQKLSLWKLEERDAFITPKELYLKQRVFEAEVRSRAWHAGIITDMIAPIVQ